jgi:hypothetical protein
VFSLESENLTRNISQKISKFKKLSRIRQVIGRDNFIPESEIKRLLSLERKVVRPEKEAAKEYIFLLPLSKLSDFRCECRCE